MKIGQPLKWRSIWMAVAIVMVVIFHSGLKSRLFLTGTLLRYGYGGVDIFMFASGIGCFASYTRDRDFGRFLKKRAWRILPVYWFVLLLWMAQKVLLCKETLYPSQIVGNIFCVQDFTGNGNEFNWYISAIWLFYLLTPFFVLLTEWAAKGKKSRQALLLAVCLLFTVSFWNASVYIITIARIPVFLLGMMTMQKAKEGAVITKQQIAFSLVLMAAGCAGLSFSYRYLPGLLWYKGFYWYPFLLITPGLCLIISCCADRLDRFRAGHWILQRLDSLGQVTLEIYISQITIYYGLRYLINNGTINESDLIWWLAVIAAVLSGILLGIARKAAEKHITGFGGKK